jgi:dipeptidyl aminopeptidase/acylaminoacyl peptidase
MRMGRAPWAVLAGALLPVPAAVAQQAVMHSSDLYKLRSVADVQLSPNGDRLAYTVEKYDRPGRPYTQLWVMEVVTGRSTQVGDSVASNPRWAPDGSKLAYVVSEGDASGLFVCLPDGSQPQFLAPVSDTNSPLPSTGEVLSWSPDAKRIAFVSATPGPETADATGDPMIITRYLYKPNWLEGLTRFNDNRRLHIFVVDLPSKQMHQVTSGDKYEHSIDWSPSTQDILFVSNHELDSDRVFNYDIFTVNASTGTIRQLTHTPTVEYMPRWSPDGKHVAYLGTRRVLTSSETTMEDTHVWVMNADGSDRRELGRKINNRQDLIAWSPDGKYVYTSVEERGNVHLYRTPLAAGDPEIVVERKGLVDRWSVSKHATIAYTLHGTADPSEAFLKSAGDEKQLTSLNTAALAGKNIATVESFTFQSFDGKTVEAFLTVPASLEAATKHPMIVDIHGGPHAQQGAEFSLLPQVYAGQGWATLMVNYRGSTGYGQEFADAIFQDQDGGEAKDIVYGVRAALGNYPWIDSARLGIEGISYGGQLTDWIITQTPMFQAAIATAGISNLVSFNYMAYYHDYLAVEFGAYPHQENLMDELWKRSALRYVARVRTPTMLVHGENDNDVPIAEAEQYYIALKDVGVQTVMLRYPREGHGVHESKHLVDLMNRSVAWFSAHFAVTDERTAKTDGGG